MSAINYPNTTELTVADLKEMFRQSGERMKQIEEMIKQTGEQIKQTDEQMKRTDKRLDKQLGKLGNRFGEVIERLVAAGVVDRFNEIGYHFRGIAPNFKVIDDDKQTLAEIDVLLENDDCFVAVEIKVKPQMGDITHHVERLKILQQYFTKQRVNGKKVIGALAGAVFEDKIKSAAIENGLYVIVQSGKAIKIDVPKNFQPKLF
jgi:hypothetical protein